MILNSSDTAVILGGGGCLMGLLAVVGSYQRDEKESDCPRFFGVGDSGVSGIVVICWCSC